jgi:hemerythrin-like domain-containing protein
MEFQRQTSHALDAEHRSTLDLLGRLERALTRPGAASAASDPALAPLAAALVRHLELDVPDHFAFEENDLFPRLVEAGEGDLAALLGEEHVTILAVVAEALPPARAIAGGGSADADHAAFRRATLELVDRLADHIDKETKALLPALEQLLDEETDRELAFAHAAG